MTMNTKRLARPFHDFVDSDFGILAMTEAYELEGESAIILSRND